LRRFGLLAAFLLVAALSYAEDRKKCMPESGSSDPCLECTPDCPDHFEFTYGVTGGAPEHLALSAGIAFADVRQLGAPLRTATPFLIQAEIGIDGGAVRFGPAVLIKAGPPRKNVIPLAGVALVGTIARTWNGELRQTYAGTEILLTAGIRFRGGLLWRIGQGNEPKQCRWTWGVGLGF
jgi:hypothetical protein